MSGRLSFFATVVALLLGALLAQPAHARVTLFADSCLLPSEAALTLEAAEAEKDWICNPKAEDAETPYLWVKIDREQLPHDQDIRVESDAMPFAALTTVVRFKNGSERVERFDEADIVAHSTSATRFSIPLYSADEIPVTVFVRIDRPFDTPVATMLALEQEDVSEAREMREMILFGVFIGMLLAVAIYSLSLSLTLKTAFGWFHAGMVLLFIIYTLASSSLIFLLLPEIGLWGRTSMSYVALALSMSLMAPFVVRFIEGWALPGWLWKLAHLSAVLMAVVGLSIPVLGPHMPFELRSIYHLSFMPGIATFFIAGVVTLTRRSRAVRLVFLAWLLPLLFALERIVRGLIGYDLPVSMDFAFFIAMAYQALVMAFAIAWRVGEIRRERDEARALERKLSQLADTDALTGLPNRRAFDKRKWRRGDFLAAVDIDRFKRINDTFGHAVGDEVLRTVGAELASLVAREQIVGAWRLGGEEFAILAEAGSANEASLVLNTLREQVSAAIAGGVIQLDEPVTVSVGVAEIGWLGIVPTYEAADRALYHAKASGRDRLCYEAAEREIATIFPRRGRRRRAA